MAQQNSHTVYIRHVNS